MKAIKAILFTLGGFLLTPIAFAAENTTTIVVNSGQDTGIVTGLTPVSWLALVGVLGLVLSVIGIVLYTSHKSKDDFKEHVEKELKLSKLQDKVESNTEYTKRDFQDTRDRMHEIKYHNSGNQGPKNPPSL